MSFALRLVILEDNPADAELMVAALREAGYIPEWQRVQAAEAYLRQVQSSPDIILADYHLPQFDALRALHLLKERGLDIPLIVVTGAMGDEAAAACIKHGAADYLLKDRLARLGMSVAQALAQRRLREAKRQVEAALRASEEQYRVVTESLNDAVYTVDREGYISFGNAALERLTGYRREELLGRPATSLYTPEAVPAIIERHRRALQGETVSPYLQTEILHKDGRRVAVEVSTSSILRDAQITRRVVVVRDITERKQLEEHLHQAQKLEAVGRLAAGVAHDFNNLLTVITAESCILLDRLDRTAQLRQNAEEILKAADLGAALTRQLLAMSRKQVLHPKKLDLNAVVTSTVKMLRRLIGKNIELVTVLDPMLGHVKADTGLLEQLILNLAINASDAMPQGGQMTLETANVEVDESHGRHHGRVDPGRYVRLAVHDTGFGMDTETQTHLFEPFFTTKEPGKGTGLGLAIVYSIVMQSNGHIEVDSMLGQGTTFRIYLPRVEDTVTTVESGIAPHEVPHSQETILLVETDSRLREFLERMLRGRGYTVLVAANGDEAVDMSERHTGPIHLLLTEVVLLGRKGPDVAGCVVSRRPTTKVLYMSTCTEGAQWQHDLLKAHTTLLEKPFTPNVLLRKIREVLAAGLTQKQ